MNTFGLKLSPYTCAQLDPVILMGSLFMRAKISCFFSFLFFLFKLILLYKVMICSKYTGRTPLLAYVTYFFPPPSVLSRDCVQWNRRGKQRKEIVLFFWEGECFFLVTQHFIGTGVRSCQEQWLLLKVKIKWEGTKWRSKYTFHLNLNFFQGLF